MALAVDIGVFAHNEAAGIADFVAMLGAQDLNGLDARIHLLANGCSDDTVARAKAAGGANLFIHDLALGGKSRTWNRFVHDLSRPDAELLVFLDADIILPAPDSLRRLVRGLSARPDLWVLNSQPIKDIAVEPDAHKLSLTDRIIAASSGGLDDWKTAICGQCYAMPAPKARLFALPIGLPVEDGFLRAMVLTDALSFSGDISRIDGLDGLFHIYESERSIAALIRHQVRIVIGSAINAALFAKIRQMPQADRMALLHSAVAQPDWVAEVLRESLPRAPYGFVPFHFLFKRLTRDPRRLLHPKQFLLAFLGFGFDAIVYVMAQIRMARGTGAGFW